MGKRWLVAAAVSAVAGLGAAMPLAPVGAQVAPTLEVSPLRVDPEETVTLTVRDCPADPEVQVGESDFIRVLGPGTGLAPGATAGTWTGSAPAGLTDWTVWGSCGDVDLERVLVDIDNPLMAFVPIGVFGPSPESPSTVYGSDCPDGTTATVTFAVEGGDPADDGSFEMSGAAVRAPIDGFGDWQAAVPALPAGASLRVSASCGEVTYAPLSWEPVAAPTSTTTTVPAGPAVSGPPPAVARPGRPSFTG